MEGIILIFGCIFLFAHILRIISRKLRLPFISILIITGYILGPSGLSVLQTPTPFYESLISNFSLSLIGLVIGGRILILKGNFSKALKTSLLLLSISVLVIFLSCFFVLTLPLKLSLLLAFLGSFTSPTHTFSIIEETNEKSSFSDHLLTLVILTEIFLLLLFPFILALSSMDLAAISMTGIFHTLGFIILSIAIGGILGYILRSLSKFTKSKEVLILEIVGTISILTGISLYLNFIPIISAVATGMVLRLRMQEKTQPIEFAKELEWLALIPFFIFAGTKLSFSLIASLGIAGIIFVSSRIVARLISAYSIKPFLKQDFRTASWLGLSLLPLGGVSLAMTLYTINLFPSYKDILLPMILGAVVFFEIFGTPLIKLALFRNRI